MFLLEIPLIVYRLNQPSFVHSVIFFRLRPPAPSASIPSLALRCGPLNFLRFEHRFLLPTSPRGSVASRCLTQSFVPLISPSTHLARNILVPTALDPCISTPLPGRINGMQLRSHLLSYFFVPRVISILAGPINDKPRQRAVIRLSVSRLVRFLSLAIFLPSQIVARLAITSSVLTDGFATRCAFCLSSLRPFKCTPDLSESQPLALGSLLFRNH